MSHFADSHWHPLVGTYTSGSVTGITWTTATTVTRGTFTTPSVERGFEIPDQDYGLRPYRIFGIIMTTAVGTKGSGNDQSVKVQVSYTDGTGVGQTSNSPSAIVSSSTSTTNTVRFELFLWAAPNTAVTIVTRTTGASLGNGVAGTYRLDYTVEAI